MYYNDLFVQRTPNLIDINDYFSQLIISFAYSDYSKRNEHLEAVTFILVFLKYAREILFLVISTIL